jgi:hypothetical protein
MGYCCCRVFGSYFSGEAVLVLLLYLYPLCLVTDVEYAIACKNLFLCAVIMLQEACQSLENTVKTIGYQILLLRFPCRVPQSVMISDAHLRSFSSADLKILS